MTNSGNTIGGSLLIPAIAMPLLVCFSLLDIAISLLTSRSYPAGSPPPNNLLLILVEGFGPFILFILVVMGTVKFFRKRHGAPGNIITFCVLGLTFAIMYNIMARGTYGANDPLQWWAILKAVVYSILCITGIPYFMFSKKVKATFATRELKQKAKSEEGGEQV